MGAVFGVIAAVGTISVIAYKFYYKKHYQYPHGSHTSEMWNGMSEKAKMATKASALMITNPLHQTVEASETIPEKDFNVNEFENKEDFTDCTGNNITMNYEL